MTQMTCDLPDDWFSNQRVEKRQMITKLAFEKSEILDLDLSKKSDQKVFNQ